MYVFKILLHDNLKRLIIMYLSMITVHTGSIKRQSQKKYSIEHENK